MSAEDIVVTPTGVRFLGRRFPCRIGRGGIVEAAEKHEGDGATPRGRHEIVGTLYRPDRMAPPAPWAVPIGAFDLWSDESGAPDYNHLVRAPYGPSHERLRRGDPMYDVILLTDWNWPHATPGNGSAIFVHQWRGPGRPTAGCVAFRRADLLWIAQRAMPGTGLVIA